MSNERDKHFLGFAKLLQKEIENKVVGIGIEDWTPTYSAKMTQDIIARRTYDLMYFIIESSFGHRENFADQIHQSVKMLPDMTEWPKDE
jgi:hypothetical protein